MTDRELLELAAKAAGIAVQRSRLDDPLSLDMLIVDSARNGYQRIGPWNPLTDDGDALRLAVKLRIDFYTSNMNGLSERTVENAVICHAYNPSVPSSRLVVLHEPFGDDCAAATRRAIVRAAAGIGKAKP